MGATETQIRLLWAWARAHNAQLRGSDRGDGILVWVIMTAILAAAAITIVAIIVNKATSTANKTKTQ